jgi:hypothetical protein
MLTKEVSQKYFQSSLTSIHKKRANCLYETSWALTKSPHLTVTSLGKHKDGKAYVKHKIKSVDRLLSNPALHAELHTIYKEFFRPLLTCVPIIYLIVDWSGCCQKELHMLRASMVHDGRSITIYNEIHPQEKVGNNIVHKKFLANLKKLIPSNSRVIVMTDAGFLTPWFKAVKNNGWDYIGRLKIGVKYQLDGESTWKSTTELNDKAARRIKSIGRALVGKKSSTPVIGNIYTYKHRPKNRKDKSRFPDVNKRYALSNKRAWVLVTSLKGEKYNGQFIVNMYGKRMQIEQNFRDEKSPRFGFGWRMGRSSNAERIAVLCLISSIVIFFLKILGMLAEQLGLHKRFQVNTESKKRVLSHINLGRQIIMNEPPPALEKKLFEWFASVELSYAKLSLY